MRVRPIKSEKEYKDYQNYINSVFGKDLSVDESDNIEIIQILIDNYEKGKENFNKFENISESTSKYNFDKKSNLDYIFELTKESSLIESSAKGEINPVIKALKLCEESGELAAEVLKLIEYKFNKLGESKNEIKNNILLESVDCMIVVFDILNKFGFTINQIIEMSESQINKWIGQIQSEK